MTEGLRVSVRVRHCWPYKFLLLFIVWQASRWALTRLRYADMDAASSQFLFLFHTTFPDNLNLFVFLSMVRECWVEREIRELWRSAANFPFCAYAGPIVSSLFIIFICDIGPAAQKKGKCSALFSLSSFFFIVQERPEKGAGVQTLVGPSWTKKKEKEKRHTQWRAMRSIWFLIKARTVCAPAAAEAA